MTAPIDPDASLDTLIENFARTQALDVSSTPGPSVPKRKEVTMEDFQKVLDSTPLFMRETPDGTEDNPVLDALRSLVFEGEGDEVALNFKDHGNELYLQKSYKDAVVAYTSGIDAGPTDGTLRITLLSNRAACNLALKNYGSVLKDAGTVIALSFQEGRVVSPKVLFRAAQALVGLERWTEARDVVARGKVGDDKAWKDLGRRVERGMKAEVERAERLRRERLGKRALREAVESRGVVMIDTPSPPDNPTPLHFDPSSLPTPLSLSETSWTAPPITTPLIYPIFLLYPSHGQSDLITHFAETTSFNDQLAVMFPSSPSATTGWAAWDTKREYHLNNLVVYVETRHRRLLKCGKDLPLVEVIAKAVKLEEGKVVDGVILRDGLMSFVVLVKGDQEKKWISEFKANRDGKQG